MIVFNAFCSHVVRGATEDELMKKAEAHAREHGIVEVTPELIEQIKANIEEEPDPVSS